MIAPSLFQWLDALFTKEKLEGTPPTYIMHRFLASDQDYVEAARVLGRDVREPDLVFRTWQGLLPKGRGAPRLHYAAPKKPPAEEALVSRMMVVLGESRWRCEDMVSVIRLTGRLPELYPYFGVEIPDSASR